MRAAQNNVRYLSLSRLLDFCEQFLYARRFGGLHSKTPSPFPAACDAM